MPVSRVAAACALLAVTLPLQSRPRPPAMSRRLAALPRVTVWSWQRREDLRTLDPRTTAVAMLDRTLTLAGPQLRVDLQRNSLLLPASSGLRRVTVVHLETRDPLLTPETARATAAALLAAAEPGTDLFQIDFDATASERSWYRLLLSHVRAGLPGRVPLSITALASWCSRDRWLGGLPVDEAVPMLFRMEPGNRGLGDPDLQIREPLCQTSLGLSTTEPWPRDRAGKRIYLFPDHGWQRDDLRSTVAAASE